MQKVKCSRCGTAMECPENMMKAEKHICAKCVDEIAPDDEEMKEFCKQLSENEPIIEELTGYIHESSFDEEWSSSKKELKELSKKELATTMFGLGIRNTFAFMNLSRTTHHRWVECCCYLPH